MSTDQVTSRSRAVVSNPDVAAWSQVSPWVASAAAPPAHELNWYRKYRMLIGVTDAVVLSAAVAATFTLLFGIESRTGGPVPIPYVLLAPILVATWWSILAFGSSHDRGVVGAGLEEYRRVITGSLYAFGTLAVASFWLHADVSRAIFVTTLPVGILCLLMGRWLARRVLIRLRARGRAMTRALVVGKAAAVADVVRDTRRNLHAGYVIGDCCVVDNPASPELAELGVARMPVKGLRQAATSGRFGAVIVADGLSREESRDLAWSLENRPIELLFVPHVMDVAGPRIGVRSVEGLALVHLGLPRFSGAKLAVKRGFDIVFSLVALALLTPLLLAIALLIKWDDRGPVLFRQERVGRYGEPFTIHKFRTMCVDAEAKIDDLIAASGGGALLFKLEDDPRITRIGKILRKYSLDELPQFWSVLRGGMSVVGPRPQVAREVAEYTDVHHRRLLIKPGITGLWQVNGRSALSMEESIRLDLRYVENWSLVTDVTVIIKTIRVVLRPSGAF